MTRAKAWTAMLAVVLGAAACSDLTFEGGGPVSITLTATPTTVATGADVTFTYDLKGEFLDGVTLDFGDGAADTAFAPGAQSAHGSFVHAYDAAGAFTAIGVAYDGRQGPDSATVVIQVTGG